MISQLEVALRAAAAVLAPFGSALAITPFGEPAPLPGTTPPGAVPSAGVWPLDPRPDVVTGFDPPVVVWGSGHRGVDLLGVVGQPVRSALPGRVTFSGSIAGKPVVVVTHGDRRTTYEPVLGTVAVGTPVAAGGAIGTLAGAPSHCAPRVCLHWGLRSGEAYLDPLTLVGALPPVRLLPLDGLPET